MLRPVSTLLFAVLGRIVGLQIQNDSLSVVLRNRCAEGFVHLVHLGFPSRGGGRAPPNSVAPGVGGGASKMGRPGGVPPKRIPSTGPDPPHHRSSLAQNLEQ